CAGFGGLAEPMEQAIVRQFEGGRISQRPALSECGEMLPRPAPLPMPLQSLWQKRVAISGRDHFSFLRLLIPVLAVLATSVFAWLLYGVVSVGQRTWLQDLFLVLCTLCFAGITVGTACAVVGAISMVVAGGRRPFKFPGQDLHFRNRTALLFPIYH